MDSNLAREKHYKSNILFILIFIIVIYYILLCASTHINKHPSKYGIYFNDYWDRTVHYLRGSWYPLKQIPYIEVFSEQPPLANYLFALPFAIIPRPDPACIGDYFDTQRSNSLFPEIQPSWYLSAYMLAFSFIMGVMAVFSIVLLLNLLEEMGRDLRLSLIFLLPATLFFTFNRFDIAPSLIILMSLDSIFRGKQNMSAALLALGTMTKAFPVLLLPVFLKYYRSTTKQSCITMILVFISTAFLCILPTLIQGGIEALMVPLQYQSSRLCNNESVYYLLSLAFPNQFSTFPDTMKNIFSIFSFAAVPFAMTAKIESRKDLIKWSLFSITVFMFFMRFYSPQWIIWIIFLMILAIESRKDLIMTILFSIVTYIEFPFGDIVFGQPSIPFTTIIVIKSIILAIIILQLACNLLPSSRLYSGIKDHIPLRVRNQ